MLANAPSPKALPQVVNAPAAMWPPMAQPVAKAQALTTSLPTPVFAPALTPNTLAAAAPMAMPPAVPMAMPVTPITVQNIAPPALPTAPTINKAEVLAPSVSAARANSVVAASTLQRLIFMVDSDTLTTQNRQQLADIGQLLAQETTARVQLRSYAMGTQDSLSDARRLSLARGLAVRGQLLQLGAKPSQIDVRALGNGGGGLDPATGVSIPADRVDVIVLR
jgi:outer membrane protein OmpA-like peptidoglycan-associated protein